MDQLEFPRMLYRVGTAWTLESGSYDVRIVDSAEEAQALHGERWRFDQYAARDAAHAPQAPEAKPEAPAPAPARRRKGAP